jgi:5-methylcytosine-specific restriction endonuclease McrA
VTTPWEETGSPWKSEAEFVSWVRGILRKGWSRHPIKLAFIQRNRKRIINPNPKNRARFPEVWGLKCAVCQGDKAQGDCEVDHISETTGTFKSLEDAVAYMKHLFMVNFSNMRIVCKDCHKAVTLAQRKQIPLEQAFAERRVNEILKEKSTEEVLDFCAKHGYSGDALSNAAKRKKALLEIYNQHGGFQ